MYFKASNVAQALKMRIPKRNPKHDVAFKIRLDHAQVLNFSLIQPIGAPPTQLSKSAPSAPQLTPFLRKKERALKNNDTSDSESSSVRTGKRQLKKQRKKTSQQTQTTVQDIQQTHVFSSEITVTDTKFSGTATLRNSKDLWTVDSNYNIPKER